MAATNESSIKNDDITQCSICLETFKEPKALPCIHTFCLHCLNKHCEDKDQEEVACPLCRKVFTIPPGGNTNLPTNFFILQLLQVKQSPGRTENEQRFCELCSDSEDHIPSTYYCVECEQQMCDRCSVTHLKAKVSRSHQVVREVGKSSRPTLLLMQMKLTLSNCDQHPGEQNRLYCYDCKMVTCPVCIANKHKKHDLADVNESAEKFREQMREDVDNVSACLLQKLEIIKKMEIDKILFAERIAIAQSEITKKYDQLLSLLESHKSQLMEELNVFKNKLLKEVQTERDEIERQVVITESFKRYCQEMMSKGTAYDISCAGYDLHARAEELMKTQDEPYSHKLSEIEITFEPSISKMDCERNFIGKLILRDTTNSIQDTGTFDFTKLLESLTVFHVIPRDGQQITGLTVLGSEIFVVRDTSLVYAYKSNDFTLSRSIPITGSKQLRALVACLHNNCLYISDWIQKIIYRYDVTSNVLINWSVRGICYGLSVTKGYNLLATIFEKKQIVEYTTNGSCIREIPLDSSINCSNHGVELATGNFVVCHQSILNRVIIVDQDGRIIQSYGGSPGSGTGQLSHPFHMIVDIRDNVLVADGDNNRVQLLSRTLTHLGYIAIPGHQLNNPYTLYFDERSHRLYIGEFTGGRVFVLCVDNNDNNSTKK